MAWSTLVESYPSLVKVDLARLTMDIDGASEEITSVVDAVFKPAPGNGEIDAHRSKSAIV